MLIILYNLCNHRSHRGYLGWRHRRKHTLAIKVAKRKWWIFGYTRPWNVAAVMVKVHFVQIFGGKNATTYSLCYFRTDVIWGHPNMESLYFSFSNMLCTFEWITIRHPCPTSQCSYRKSVMKSVGGFMKIHPPTSCKIKPNIAYILNE